ncbi:MAG: zinc-binding dehydrogenase, partial [Brevibacterium aurantiacum]|nr:zinc-binding dehydrogenase [Brevibacterium aurantiacum]
AAARERPDYIAEQWDAVADYVAAGKLNPAIHATPPLEEAAKAIGELDSRSVRGKVLLKLKGE